MITTTQPHMTYLIYPFVHCQGPEAHAAAACAIVSDVMRHPFPLYGLSVPLEVDARVAETWYEAKGGAPIATTTPTPTATATATSTKEEQNSGSEAAPVPPANLNGKRVWLNGATRTTRMPQESHTKSFPGVGGSECVCVYVCVCVCVCADEEEVEEQIEALHGHHLEDDIVLAMAEARA